jgi:HEAT repeat protein
VIDEARNDKDPHVRGQALFWLAQKAGNRETARAISSAVANDPDRAVKERAVFALQQLPNGEGVPLLIEVAKANPDPQVRKKAMFWLGQSKDPRALEFFAQVLK